MCYSYLTYPSASQQDYWQSPISATVFTTIQFMGLCPKAGACDWHKYFMKLEEIATYFS